MSTLRDETLSDLLKALWTARLFLLVGGVVGFICASLIILFAVPHMRSIMIVAPAAQTISLGTPETAQMQQNPQETLPFLRYLKILTGPNVVKSVLTERPTLKDTLQEHQRFTFQSPKAFETIDDLSMFLTKNMVIKPVGETPLRTIELEHPNPDVTRDVLLQLHKTADHMLRQEMLERTEARLSYLKNTLSQTANPDHRQALTNLLIEQERLGMMLRMDRYYAAVLVEPPYIQPKPVWPRKSYIFPLCILVGMMMGWVTYGVVRSYE